MFKNDRALQSFEVPFNALPLAARDALVASASSGRANLLLATTQRPVIPLVGWLLLALVGGGWSLRTLLRLPTHFGLVLPLFIALGALAVGVVGTLRTVSRLLAPIPEGVYLTACDVIFHRRGKLYAVPWSIVTEVRATEHFTNRKYQHTNVELITARGPVASFSSTDREKATNLGQRAAAARAQLTHAVAQGDGHRAAELDPLGSARSWGPDGTAQWRTEGLSPGPRIRPAMLGFVSWPIGIVVTLVTIFSVPIVSAMFTASDDRLERVIREEDLFEMEAMVQSGSEDSEALLREHIPEALRARSARQGRINEAATYLQRHRGDASEAAVLAVLNERLAAYAPGIRPLLIDAAASHPDTLYLRVVLAPTPPDSRRALEGQLSSVTGQPFSLERTLDLDARFRQVTTDLGARLQAASPPAYLAARSGEPDGTPALSVQVSLRPSNQSYPDPSGQSTLVPVDVDFTIVSVAHTGAPLTSQLTVPAPANPTGVATIMERALDQLAAHLSGLVLVQ